MRVAIAKRSERTPDSAAAAGSGTARACVRNAFRDAVPLESKTNLIESTSLRLASPPLKSEKSIVTMPSIGVK